MKHTRTHPRTTKKLLHFIITSFYLLLGQFLIRGITSFTTSNRMMRYSVINTKKHDPTINLLRIMATATEAETSSSSSSPKSASSSGKKHRPLHSVQSMLIGQQSLPNNGDSTVEKTETTSTTVVSSSSSTAATSATLGDIITLNLELVPEDGFVPEHLFDSTGEITFVLGWGNYLPGLHELVLASSGVDDGIGMSVGEEITNISMDAGFGRHNPELVIEIPKRNLQINKDSNKNFIVEEIKPNTTLSLQGGIEVTVLEVTTDTIVVDANHPLAGSSYLCSFTLINIDPFPIHKLGTTTNNNIAPATKEDPTRNTNRNELEEEELAISRTITTTTTATSPFDIATFSMGCFWGVELAFMRTRGVVGTRVGYSNGSVVNPSYAEIKEGNTNHRESVMVIYDSRVTSYHAILAVYKARFAITSIEYGYSPLIQYQHGIYFHTNKQKEQAKEFISSAINSNNNCDVDLLPATTFYTAEEVHQQYLYKGGQAARKGCRDSIRCHG